MLVKDVDFFRDIFDAYPHQRELMRAFFGGKYKFFMECIHRRGGKDATLFNIAWVHAAMQPGNYVYTLPKIAQARNVIWEGTDLDGFKWLDKIPKHLMSRPPNQTSCKLYINDSILHITGADNLLQSHLGSNLSGIFISEFQRTHPAIWDYMRPILKRSKGFAAFAYTALGKGHAHRLFEQNKNNPEWHCRKLTVADTRDNSGNYIFSPEQIEEERQSGMEEDLIQQEYYCDESVAVKGTFFAQQIELAVAEGRIKKGIEVLPGSFVHTSWDLGSRDTNSIWFFQVVGIGKAAQFRYFYQHDHNYGDTEYYIKLLEQVRQRFGFKAYGKHFMPHDINQTEYTSGKTRRVAFMSAGITPTPVPMVRVIERVQIARGMFAQCHFDEIECRHGLDALTVSRSRYDENARAFTADEVHDWASHASAAFQYGHVGWMDTYNKKQLMQMKEYARSRQ